jgi:hypothetical protein
MGENIANQRNELTVSRSSDITAISQPSSAIALLRESGAPEWEIVLFQMAQDKRHDLDPAILPYWTAKLKGHSDAMIAEVLMEGRWKFFPSVDEVLEALEGKAERRYQEREAERAQQPREFQEKSSGEAAAVAAIVKEAVLRMKSIPYVGREPVRSPRNVLALSQSSVLRSVGGESNLRECKDSADRRAR